MQRRRGLVLQLLFVASLSGVLAACAAFPQHEVRPDRRPDVERDSLGTLYVDLEDYQGRPGRATPDGAAYNEVFDIVRQSLHDIGWFHTLSFEDRGRAQATHELHIAVYAQTGQTLPIVSAIFSYFSFFILPTMSHTHFIVEAEAIDPQSGRVLARSKNHDAIHSYAGILMAPALIAGKTPNRALNTTLDAQIKAAVIDLEQQGAWL